jgi:trehalose 6-phosphate phosphatase
LNALPTPAELLRRFEGKRIAFGFDFDGTLVEIARTPEGVLFDEPSRRALDEAGRRHRTLICTGRALGDLSGFLTDPAALDLIGNHGLEWRLRGQGPRTLQPIDTFRREGWFPWLEAEVAAVGGRIEDKGISLTLHYRSSGHDRWVDARLELQAQVGAGLVVLAGKECWNILAQGVSKGRAVEEYAREFRLDAVVYFGDEPTDETVFELGSEKGFEVVGVKVGEGRTSARYRVPDVTSVRAWLAELATV